MNEAISHTPSRIIVAEDKKSITVEFAHKKGTFTAEILRVLSPSAEVQGHSEAERKLIGGKKHVAVKDIEAVGNYAIRIIFDDGHNTGLYSWQFLSDLMENYDERVKTYIAALEKAGLSRES